MATKEQWLASFPDRFWFWTGKGWASRTPTAEDKKDRRLRAENLSFASRGENDNVPAR